jgi:hypothetical protein
MIRAVIAVAACWVVSPEVQQSYRGDVITGHDLDIF